jgi:hypothetical protein
LQIKATHPIFVISYEKMKKFIENETAKGKVDGFDAKDVS